MFKSAAFCVCLCAFIRNNDAASDSIPEAITVYRNPEFFKNIHYESDQSIYEFDGDPYEDEESESESEDESEEYKYPGEPKKPNPPAPPNFEVTFDRSPEFNHEPRDIFRGSGFTPKRGRGPYGHPRIEENEEISNLFTESAIEIEEGDDENPKKEEEEEEEEEEVEVEEEEEDGNELNELNEEQNEEVEQDNEEAVDENEETPEEPETFDEEEQESNLPETYEESGSYEENENIYRPNSHSESHSYSLPGGSYEDSSSYSHPNSYSHSYSSHSEDPEKVVDRKKGTREYYKHHKKPESDDIADDDDDDERNGNIVDGRDTKLVFKKKLFLPIKKKPVLIFKYNKKPKHKKLKIKFKKPRKFLYFGGRFARQAHAGPRKVPDNSAYQLSSDKDLDYQRI